MVYTEEKLRDNTFRYMRHHLRGTPKKLLKSDGSPNFWKIDWSFEKLNPFCSYMKGKVWATTNLHEYSAQNNHIAFKFIEIYETNYKILEMVFVDSSDAFEIRSNESDLRPNTDLMNCGAIPKNPLSESLSDGRENMKLDPMIGFIAFGIYWLVIADEKTSK